MGTPPVCHDGTAVQKQMMHACCATCAPELYIACGVLESWVLQDLAGMQAHLSQLPAVVTKSVKSWLLLDQAHPVLHGQSLCRLL